MNYMLNENTAAPAAAGAATGRTFDGATGDLVETGFHAPAAVSQIDALPPKAEAFAQHYVAHGNATVAYRLHFDCAPTTARTTIARKAHALRHSPPVAARIRELQTAATESFTVSIGERMQHLHTIATADLSEVVRLVHECCRGCYAEGGHPFQWRDEAELARAYERHLASLAGPKPQPAPDVRGGFGFVGTRDPNPDCAHCDGKGVERVTVAPSDEWSAAARAAFKGARQKADGSVELEFENKLTASDQLARLAGFYVERSESRNLNLSVTADLALANDVDALLAAYKRGTPQ